MNLVVLTFYALLTCLATGLGALPFAVTRHVSGRWAAAASGAAGLLMLAASAGLFAEALGHGPLPTLGGAALGALLVGALRRATHDHPDSPADLVGSHALSSARVFVLFWVLFAHSFAEGVAVGVSFAGGERLGLLVTLTMALHNVPEGLAIALVAVPRGVSWQKAAGLAVLTSLPQPLVAVPAYLFVEAFRPMLPIGLGFAAGAMVWLSLTDLLPDAVRGWRAAEATPDGAPAALP